MAALFNAPSRCSGDAPISFKWYGSPVCSDGEDLDTAVEVLLNSVSGGTRVWNPYAKAMVKAEFRTRLKLAAKGALKPIDQVKAIDISNPPPLYEIRWQEIDVTDLHLGGAIVHSEVLVRFYHAEPVEFPEHFVGHHAHEKDISVEDVNGAQQVEILKAIEIHNSGKCSNWGIA